MLLVDSKMTIYKNDKGELCGRPKYKVYDAEWLEDFEISNRKDEFPELHDYIERLIIRT